MAMNLFYFFLDNWPQLLDLTGQHLFLVSLSLTMAICLGIPIGILITKQRQLLQPVIQVVNAIMTIPSIALFGVMLPLLSPLGYGLGKVPAIAALTLYSLMPIVHNTFTAIQNVEPALVDAGRGIGLTRWQLLWEVELPLATPLIISGVRTATMMNIGITTIAAYIGAGGLGELIQQGISRSYIEMILAGALVVSLLAVIIEVSLSALEKKLTPYGLKIIK